MTAPDDLIICGARLAGSQVSQSGTERHRELFRNYLRVLRPMVELVSQWWLEQVEYQTRALGTEAKARKALIIETPAGPAGHVQFAPIVREYWLACDALNATLDKRDWVDPPKFLLQWLIDARDSLCVEVLASQPYWPMGLSKDGRWF
ncbi:MAG TPA: hypothetical protein VLV86_10570 [Vicinamibacterales bacterium]|nr:hypothetical protein [Vicinamibacterales bacterium]